MTNIYSTVSCQKACFPHAEIGLWGNKPLSVISYTTTGRHSSPESRINSHGFGAGLAYDRWWKGGKVSDLLLIVSNHTEPKQHWLETSDLCSRWRTIISGSQLILKKVDWLWLNQIFYAKSHFSSSTSKTQRPSLYKIDRCRSGLDRDPRWRYWSIVGSIHWSLWWLREGTPPLSGSVALALEMKSTGESDCEDDGEFLSRFTLFNTDNQGS